MTPEISSKITLKVFSKKNWGGQIQIGTAQTIFLY